MSSTRSSEAASASRPDEAPDEARAVGGFELDGGLEDVGGHEYGGFCARCGRRHAIGAGHGAAQEAADLLDRSLQAGRLPTPVGSPPGPSISPRFEASGGQMIGVLVARAPDGQQHLLRAFSGRWDGRARVPGWAPPLVFPDGDPDWWIEGTRALDALGEAIETERSAVADLRETLHGALRSQRQAFDRDLEQRLAARRAARRARARARSVLQDGRLDPATDPRNAAALEGLDAESRREKADIARFRRRHRQARSALQAELAALEAPARDLSRQRRDLSRRLMRRIHAAYRIVDRAGREHRLQCAHLEPDRMPGGVGDCCAPRLLAWASRQGLEPLGMAEIWIGAPPTSGVRQQGRIYGACERLCQPLLGFMLCPRPLRSSEREQGRKPERELEVGPA